MIWGPTDSIGDFLSQFCPSLFKTVPVGPYATQEKYWPLIWLVCPMYILLPPITFGMCAIFDHQQISHDFKHNVNTFKKLVSGKHNFKKEKEESTINFK